MQKLLPPEQPFPALGAVSTTEATRADMISKLDQERKEDSELYSRAYAPNDLRLPEGIEDITSQPELVHIYNRAMALSDSMSATMLRKRAEWREMLKGPRSSMLCFGLNPGAHVSCRRRKLRIVIWNTAKNQPWENHQLDESAFDFNSGIDPTYRVVIKGKLLPAPEEDKIYKEAEENTPEKYWYDVTDDEEEGDSAKGKGD